MSNAKLKALQAADEQRRLSKEQLLTPAIRTQEELIPSLGGTVILQSLSYKRREEIRGECGWQTPNWDEAKFNLYAIAASLVDPELTFKETESLAEQNSTAIDELILKINLLNLLGKAEEVKKESSPTPNSDSD